MSFAQPARPRYSMAQHGQGSNDNFGNLILRPGAGNIRRPSWKGTETVIRFLPKLAPDRSSWEPYRNSIAPRDFGDWIRAYPAVRSFGEGQGAVTMLLFDPVAQPAYDIRQNPCVMIYNSIHAAIKNRQEQQGWAALTRGEPGKGAPLGRHTDVYIARGAIFRIGDKDMATAERSPLGLSDGEPAMYIELSDSAGRALMDLLELVNENYDYSGSNVDFDQYYVAGDVVSIDKGAFIHFYQEGHDPRQVQQNTSTGPRQIVVTGSRGASPGGNQGGDKGFKRFACHHSLEWKNYSPNLDDPNIESVIRKKDRPWDDSVQGPGSGCLNFMSDEQQAAVLQERDAFPASVFMYAFQDHQHLIVERTRNRVVGRTTFDMGEHAPEQPAMQPVVQPAMQRTPVVQYNSGMNPTSAPARRPAGGWGQKAHDEVAEQSASQSPAVDESAQAIDGDTRYEPNAGLPESANDKEKDVLASMHAARERMARPPVPGGKPQL